MAKVGERLQYKGNPYIVKRLEPDSVAYTCDICDIHKSGCIPVQTHECQIRMFLKRISVLADQFE